MSERVALVSGGTSGIGKAVAERLRVERWTVTAFADDGNGVETVCVDVTDAAAVEELVAGTIAEHGRIDGLCNAAGVKAMGTAVETELPLWERTLAVNVTGPFLLARAVLPHMIAAGGGAIVNIGSPSGYGGAGHVAYCASKGALLALSASLALDHIGDGIRVNTVVPGSTRTAMNRGRSAEIEALLAKTNVAGRVNEPEDVAEAVAFLLSDRAATISGAILEVGWPSGQMVPRIEEPST